MADVINSILSLLGQGSLYFASMRDMLAFFFRLFIALVLISGMFRAFGKLAELFMNFRRW